MPKPLSILFVSSETYPFAKTGGLADVSYSLPLAIRELGHDIRVMMPKYGSISERKNKIQQEINRLRDIPVGDESRNAAGDVEILFDEQPAQRVRPHHHEYQLLRGFYNDPLTGEDYSNNNERFIFFNKTVCGHFIVLGWFPDIIHCNDWQTRLSPRSSARSIPKSSNTPKSSIPFIISIMPVVFRREVSRKPGLPEEAREMVMHKRPGLNFVKAGIMYSDHIPAIVSPTYSADVMNNSAHSDGLNEVIAWRHGQLPGVLHGVDMFLWNPKTDAYLARNYDRRQSPR